MRGEGGFGFAAACVAVFAACAGGGRLSAHPELQGAEGVVRFSRTPENDVSIILSIKHLRDPRKLEPAAWAYVAWVRDRRDDPAHNVGAIALDKDFRGELKTKTPLRAFELFVTAEALAAADKPSGKPLLWADRFE